MNGLEVAAHLKQLERSRDIPIIFITAFGDDPERDPPGLRRRRRRLPGQAARRRRSCARRWLSSSASAGAATTTSARTPDDCSRIVRNERWRLRKQLNRATATAPTATARSPGPPDGAAASCCACFLAVRDGDFSVRLPGALDRPDRQDRRLGQRRGRAPTSRWPSSSSAWARWWARRARPASACASRAQVGAWADMESLGQHADRRPALAHHRGDPRAGRRGPGRPVADHAAGRGRPAAAGRVPALGDHRQLDDQAAAACSPPR